MRIGSYDVLPLRAGDLWLDGGAMFGVVPRVLWQDKMPPDSANRIEMSMNVLLVRGEGLNLLVDTGAGDKEGPDFAERFGLSPWALPARLGALGVSPSEIQVVFNSHLHFDHAGGNTVRDEGGSVRPAFPNARYLVQRREFEDAMSPNERNRASYFRHNFKPLFDSGQMELLDGEAEVAPGLRAFPLPGHTLGLQGLFLESGGERALYLTDCVPTTHHLPIPWVMAYDLFPLTTLETKKLVLPRAAREGWTLFFEHDPKVPAARIEEEMPGRFRVIPLAPEDL